MRKKCFIFCAMLSTLVAVSLSLVFFHARGYRVNRSASLPGTIYHLTPLRQDENLRSGDCVAIDLSQLSNPVIGQGVERGYVNLREPMLKRIGAIPGDRVTIVGDRLYVNAYGQALHISSSDSHGGALSAWPTPLILSRDHFWLVSDPLRGFDSRYFGPLERRFFSHRADCVF